MNIQKDDFLKRYSNQQTPEKLMQFQIECNSFYKNQQTCLTCKEPFEMKEARVIVCNERGDGYGDICPKCIAMGYNWIGKQLQQLNHVLSR